MGEHPLHSSTLKRRFIINKGIQNKGAEGMDTKKEKENNVYIFPLLKRAAKKNITMKSIERTEIDDFVNHYMKQLLLHLDNHGIQLNNSFYRDYNLVHESLRSSLYRQGGYFHPIQDMVEVLSENKKKKV